MDHVVASAARHVEGQEAGAQAACFEAATVAGHTIERAESCEGGELCCAFCPWRNPFNLPGEGDQFVLRNGREIVVDWINLAHTVEPRVSYTYTRWRREDGGRATYETWVRSWPGVVRGATLKRIGAAPKKYSALDQRHRALREVLFRARNARIEEVSLQNAMARGGKKCSAM